MSPFFSRRLLVISAFFIAVFLIFVGRLFYLQVIQYDKYFSMAKEQHEKRSILPAQRGKILVRKNPKTTETTPLATNHTLKMLFVDPLVLAYPKYSPRTPLEQQERGNPLLAAKILAPLLIHAHCEKIDGCDIQTNPSLWSDTEKIAIDFYQKELEQIFTEIEKKKVSLLSGISDSRRKDIETLQLPGVFFDEENNLFANPTLIDNPSEVAEKLSPFINIPKKTLQPLLTRSVRRYVEIVHKIVPEVSEKIIELKNSDEYRNVLRGVQLRDEQWRYYPEKSLAAQVLGFVDDSNQGQYGIEGRFDQDLAGQAGFIFGAANTRGQQILRKNSQISLARDGADIVLSLDRVIQGEVEKILEEDTQKFDADSGQIIVLDPQTGRILALAHYPTFDPNEYKKVFSRYEISPEQEIEDRENELFNQRIPTIKESGKFFRYFNIWGPKVFRNMIVSDQYEPGSVMKPLTMAAAINSQEVTPQTVYNDSGPVKVDEFTIQNADKTYAGTTSMLSVISRSLNTGIVFIVRKMGAKLFYQYLRDYGFGQYTFIDLDGEASGKLDFWTKWTESDMVTKGFGQGIVVTPIQMAIAFSTLANGGYLVKPLLVEQIRYSNGAVKNFLPEKIRRVLSAETTYQLKEMLLYNVDKGGGSLAHVKGYTVMGKTGTSQTYKNGKALEGVGTTIASFIGFGPFKNPQFLVMVKYDYPKASQWGSETAAFSFRRIAEFLFRHMNIPPDR